MHSSRSAGFTTSLWMFANERLIISSALNKGNYTVCCVHYRSHTSLCCSDSGRETTPAAETLSIWSDLIGCFHATSCSQSVYYWCASESEITTGWNDFCTRVTANLWASSVWGCECFFTKVLHFFLSLLPSQDQSLSSHRFLPTSLRYWPSVRSQQCPSNHLWHLATT